jgi:pantetheine-phosphate adenylyltransferase
MNKAIYLGSFDPITYGHMDIIERARHLYDELIVVVSNNPAKKYLFDAEERKNIVEEIASKYDNVRVEIHESLGVEFVRQENANVMIRGLRAVSDFEYEMKLATANQYLAPEIETVFLMSKPANSFLSSSQAKEIAKYDGDVSAFVPEFIAKKLKDKYDQKA